MHLVNDDFDSFKKPELKIKTGQQKDENDVWVMISDDDAAEISKSLIKTEIDIESKNNLNWKKNKNRKPYKKPITRQNLQDGLDFAFNDVETVDYNNDTKLDDLDGLENVDYNNDASITDLVPIKKLETIKEENDDVENGLQITKTVNYGNITDDDDVLNLFKKFPCILEKELSVLAKIT